MVVSKIPDGVLYLTTNILDLIADHSSVTCNRSTTHLFLFGPQRFLCTTDHTKYYDVVKEEISLFIN